MDKVRTVVASYWTALVLGVVAVFLHVRWYTVDKAPGSEVVSGFGASLVVLGVFVGSRPYIRSGIIGMIQSALPKNRTPHYGSPETGNEHRKRVEKERPKVTRDIWAERVVAVAIVILGTLLNGYGSLISQTLDLR